MRVASGARASRSEGWREDSAHANGLCLLVLALPIGGGVEADRTTVLAREAGRELTLSHGLETMAEGLVIAALGDCSVEVGDDAANRKEWDEVLQAAAGQGR